jgi:NACHT domain/Ribbon-helix-helix protein, copG family/Restriction endonuclease
MSDPTQGPYRTKTGRHLTDADIDALAAEAEQAYDPGELARRPGRPRMGSSAATVVPVRLHADLQAAVKELAGAESTSVSELIRDALRSYLATEPTIALDLQTTSGHLLTDADIEALAADAETDHNISAVRGQPKRRSRGRTEVVPVRMAPELKATVERRAEAESTSVSEIVRAALRGRLGSGDPEPPNSSSSSGAHQHARTEGVPDPDDVGRLDPEWLEIVEDPGSSSLRHLTSPPESEPLAVGTRLQTLPFHLLTWPDFERLCYRLCRRDGEVENCMFYGVAGQMQAGIDIFMRRRDGGYRVVQCKRWTNFTAGRLAKAVDKFLEGRWADDADSFILATSGELASVADAVKVQADRLALKGIAFIMWDASALDDELKKSPDLVLDFFGRAAVELFFDASLAAQVAGRLDLVQLREYRMQLGDLYRRVVSVQDPGIVTKDASTPLHLRFVMPDVILEDEASSKGVADARPADVQVVHSHRDDHLGRSASIDMSYVIPEGIEARVSAEQWLASGNRKLVIGEPGSGKSALLRFLLLDIFEGKPRSEPIARRWGDSIPLWLPFGFWTERARQRGGSIGLEECVRAWLGHWSRADLWPLVHRAITDERLVLFVDGLDEWATQPLGAEAVQQLLVYANNRGCPVVATSRPFGVQSLPLATGGWELGRIAPLSDGQRREMVNRWLESWWSSEAATPRQTMPETLIAEMEASEHIRRLSRNPLLLSILLFLRSVHNDLPSDWATVLDHVVSHLLGQHRSQKMLEAASSNQVRHTHDVKRLAVLLAAAVQERGQADVLSYEDALAVLVAGLSNGHDLSLGYARSEAVILARDLLDSVSTGLGLIVLPGDDSIGFIHRYIQEYLCAEHLLLCGEKVRRSTIIKHLDDPKWREVITLCLQRMTDRHEIQTLFEAFDGMGLIVGEIVDQLAAAVSFASSNELDYETRERLADRVFTRIELGERIRHRLQLISQIPDALRSPMREPTLRRIDGWIWGTRKYPNIDDFTALARWPIDQLTEQTLWTGVLSDHRSVQRVCASILGDLHARKNDLRDRLLDLALSTNLVGRRAAAIEALGRGWPSEPALDSLISDAIGSPSPELLAAAVAADLRRGNITPENRDRLLHLGELEPSDSVWPFFAGELLAQHFPHDPVVLETYLGAVRHPQSQTSVGIPPAVSVLLTAFTGEPRVRAWVINEIRTAQYPFTIGQAWPWKLVANAYRNDDEVVSAIEEWTLRDDSGAHDVELSAAARVGRSPRVRSRLLRTLRESSLPSWAASALIATYDDDDEVQEALHALAIDDAPARSQQIAELIPEILTPHEALVRLLELASAPDVTRLDRVASGLAALRDRDETSLNEDLSQAVDQIVEMEIAGRRESNGSGRTSAEYALFANFASVTSVRDLALSRLSERDVHLSALVYGFHDDLNMRAAIAPHLFPLPSPLRARLVQVLADVPLSDVEVTSRLDRFDADADDTVKILGAVAAATRARRTEHAGELADRLTAMAGSVGLDHDERRCAAFAGLVTLGMLDRLVGLHEPFRPNDLLTIPSPLAGQGGPFFRILGENWTSIRETFGDDAEVRLSRFEPKSLWQGLLAVAPDYPALRADALHRVVTEPVVARPGDLDSWSYLIAEARFLARVEPGSNRVRDRCVRIVEAGGGLSYAEQLPFWQACELLAVQFRNDPRTADWLGAHLDEQVHRLAAEFQMSGSTKLHYIDPVVVAASRIRPDDDRLRRIASSAMLDAQLSFEEVELCFSTFDTSGYAALVDRVAATLSWTGWYSDLLVRPAVGRLVFDHGLAAELEARLYPTDSKPLGTVMRLIAASGQLSGTFSRLIRERREQLLTRFPRLLVYDPVAGEVRGEDLVLRDIEP